MMDRKAWEEFWGEIGYLDTIKLQKPVSITLG